MRTMKTISRYGDGSEKERILLVADTGKMLTNDNGATWWDSVEVDDASGWVEDSPDLTAEEALDIIMGGNTA